MKKWQVRVRKGPDVDVEGTVYAYAPDDAFLRFVRRRGIWPKGAAAYLERSSEGYAYWAYPVWRIVNTWRIGDRIKDRYEARIIPVEEVQG